MYANNDEARAVLFTGFGGFQASFSSFLATYAKEADKAKRAALASAFVKETAIPYLDSAKNGLLEAIVPPLLAADAELSKLLHVFGGGDE